MLQHYCLYSWVSLGYFAVNLSGSQPKIYWWFCCTGVKKSHEIAHICCQTQGQHILTVKNYFPPMTVHRFGVDPQWNYDVMWNPRILKWWHHLPWWWYLYNLVGKWHHFSSMGRFSGGLGGVKPPLNFSQPLQKMFNPTRMLLHSPGTLWFAISCSSQSIKNGILHMTTPHLKFLHPSCEKKMKIHPCFPVYK